MINKHLKDLTCLIPLYKSKIFLDIIEDNINGHLDSGAFILVSDRHEFDDTARILQNKYRKNQNVKVLINDDEGDWVDNINYLLMKAETEFARIIPHDDTASAESSIILLQSLQNNEGAVMATGIVKAFDALNNPIPIMDALNINENEENEEWTFHDMMGFFWGSRFNGSFKGVFNLNLIKQKNIFIKKTPTLAHSERLWLTALAMIGRYQFEPRAVLIKRYYESSTHRKWVISPQVFLNSADILYEYCKELISDQEILSQAEFIIYHNAITKARYLENKTGPPPKYIGISQNIYKAKKHQ